MKVAYITYRGPVNYAAANGFNESTDLLPFLQQRGLDITAEIWDDPTVDWAQYDVALLKTPWDYHEKIASFRGWLDRLQALHIRLINPYEVVRWNLDKQYLKEVSMAGFPVIPSIFLQKDWTGDMTTLFGKLHTDSIIVKPCISGGSKNTMVVKRQEAPARYDQVVTLLQQGDYMVQPLLPEVEEGEWSFLFFGGRYSHAILKKPKKGDFRVQQIYGGTIETRQPTQVQIAVAAAYVDRFAKACLYARVDGLQVNGEFMLMELELIEPFLYLSYGEHAVEDYYQALVQQLAGG